MSFISSSRVFQTVRTDKSLDSLRPKTDKILSSVNDAMIALSVLAFSMDVFGALGSGVQCLPIYANTSSQSPPAPSYIPYIQKLCSREGLSVYAQYLGYGFIVQIWLLMVVENFWTVWSKSATMLKRCVNLVRECEALRLLRGRVILQLNHNVGNYNIHQWTEEQQKWISERNAEEDLTSRDAVTPSQLHNGIALSLKVSEFLDETAGSRTVFHVFRIKSLLRLVLALAFAVLNLVDVLYFNEFEFGFYCNRDSFINNGFTNPETTFDHLRFKCTYLVAGFSRTLVLIFAAHLVVYCILSAWSLSGWNSINHALDEILAEYKKTSAVEEMEEKLENLDFCDLKLMLFLLKAGNPEGFVAFKDFLSPLFQRELITITNGTTWNEEHLEKRTREVQIQNEWGYEVNLDGLEVDYLPPALLDSEKNILSLSLSYNKALKGLQGIGKLKQLKKLEAEGCDLESAGIDFEELSSLISLNLMKNKLDVLPNDIGLLENLRELKIDDNRFPRLPAVLNNMSSLKTIICDDHLMETLDAQAEIWRMEDKGIYKKI